MNQRERNAMDIVISAAKVRRDDLHHMATDLNKGKREAALIQTAIECVESAQEQRDMAAQDWRLDA